MGQHKFFPKKSTTKKPNLKAHFITLHNRGIIIISCISLVLFTIAFGTHALATTSSEDNLVANPGFDNVTDSIPLNWTLISGAGTVAYDAVEGHDNPGSIQIDVPGTEDAKSGYPKSDLIDAQPDTLYTFSAWGKSIAVDGTNAPAVRVVELNSTGGWITQHNLGFSRDSGWEQKQTTFITNPNASKLYVYANIWNSYGTFFVDDIYLSNESTTNPPVSITNLRNITGHTWINWTWTLNPEDASFNHIMVYLNGMWQENTSDSFYNATALLPDNYYELSTRTAGEFGNVNETWVNQTAKTEAETSASASTSTQVAVPKKILHATKEDFDAGTKKGVEVQKYGVITLVRKNLLDNPSFETESTIKGLADKWWIYNPSGGDYTTTLDANTSTSGSKSQKISFNSNSTAPLYLGQTLHGVENNTGYTFSADVKIDNPGNMSAKLSVELWGNGKYITASTSAVTESTSFTRLTMTITTTPDTDEIRAIVLLIPNFSGATGAMWVDSAQLEKSDSPTQYAPCYTTTSGEYVSPPIDMGANTTPYKIECTSSVKPEGDVKFQIRSASTLEELNYSPWYGPASTEDYYGRHSCEGTDLLLNPSLESDSNSNGIPDYSRHMGWGTNDANFTVVSDAYEGSKAVKVEITNYTSGDRRWEILYEGIIERNSCYLFEVWHKENGNIGDIRIAVSVEKTDGSTSWGYSGRYISSSIDWKHNKLFFRTPNYEVKKIWLEVILAKEGWIISDAYSLKKVNFDDEWSINPVHIKSRWMQYKVDFSTTDLTYSPSVHDVTIKYGASVPEIHWVNVLADDERQKYAFEPGETANFKVEVLDFKGVANIDHVNISIFDTNENLVLQDKMTERADVSDVKRYYEYQYSFPVSAGLGTWKVNITAMNKEGQNCSENVFLKIKEPYISPPQKMTLGVLECYGFRCSSAHAIEKYSKYPGVEIWKLSIGWDLLEPDHGSFDESYINKISEFMDGAHENGAKAQIGIQQQFWPVWVSNGNWDNQKIYEYKATMRLANTWMRLADRIKDHPALDSYLIINEENHVYDADIYLRGLNEIASSIRSVDNNLSHRITIRPNTVNSYIRTRIAQDGIQDYDYGAGVYPTSYAWHLDNYESPVSETSYLRMSKLRSSPVAYGCPGGVGEIGFGNTTTDSFGDDERLAAFERAMSIAYDQGMDEFMIWDNGFGFADPETYFPMLTAFRDELVTQPRSNHFDVRILIDNGEWFYTGSPSTESALNMSNQPYKHLVEMLDEGGYTWFYTHSDAVSLQNISYNVTINLSEMTPSGKRYPWHS